MLVSRTHPWNAPASILVRLDGSVMLVSPVQVANVFPPIDSIPSDKVMLVSPVHPSNAPTPILVTLDGIVIDVREAQPVNAKLPILVTPAGIITDPVIDPLYTIKYK